MGYGAYERGFIMQSLQQSVQSVIDDGRIGSPVFLRCMVHLHSESGTLAKEMASLTTLANTWMPSSPEQIYALESEDTTQTSAMIKYVGGQSALLSINRVPDNQEASVDLMLVGNKGVIYHETPVGQHRLMKQPIELNGGGNLIDLVNQALKTGKPVETMED